jgi:hypothetical protein
MNINVLEPDVTVNEPVPVDTEAETAPLAIWVELNPVIALEGILFNPAPLP